jgi:CRISPR-associated protein Cas1
MTDRIIEISEYSGKLSVTLDNLVLECEGETIATIPISDIGALIISNPRIIMTQAVISRLSSQGGIVVVCDEKFQPAAMMLPLDSHFIQSERFRKQALAPKPLQKRIWQQIVTAKIKAQANVLTEMTGSDRGLVLLAGRVTSGDAGNIEAQAAQRYWPALFNDKSFRRNRYANDQNRLLNYGYTILRALTARAICGSGLHPSLGVNHHNKYDNFCLASDIMEPFRPLIDKTVALLIREVGTDVQLNTEIKKKIIEALLSTFYIDGEERTLFSILARTASSLADVYSGTRKKLSLPDL